MKKLFLFVLSALFAFGSFSAFAATDRDGMPIVYLRGDFTKNVWTVNENYRFTRSGDNYTLILDSSNAIGQCEFKIGTDDWMEFDMGAPRQDYSINSSESVNCIWGGPNFSTNGLNDCIISFTYNPDAISIRVNFIVSQEEIQPEPEPVPGEYPDVYLRGDFTKNVWIPDNNYKFTCTDDGLYTLNITSANSLPAGCQFKIGDEGWSLVDLGAVQQNIAIDYTQNLNMIRRGENLTTANGISEGTISFRYTPDNMDAAIVSFTLPGTQKPPVSGLSGTLPVLYINVYTDKNHTAFNNEVISKDLSHKNYFEFAEYWLDTNGCQWLEELGAKNVGSEEEPLPLQIKARGNWTRIGFSKKPFKLKLDKKQSLLGLSKSKHFAILAHADDNQGYLRNFVGFNLGKRIGLPWTPSQQPVEVVINGDYRGLYFLTESIRVDEDRVNITELGDNVEDAKLVSGGYIVELDNYNEDDSAQIRMEENHLPYLSHLYDLLRITFDTPEVYSDLQRLFITDQFIAMNNYVGSNDDLLWSYLDLDDAARYYLVEEIVSHVESYHGSTYLFRDYGDGQKWHFSPLWDFGNAFNGQTDNFFYNCDPYGNTWIPSMRENSKFNSKVIATWLWFMSNGYKGIESDIDEYASRVQAAANADYARWHDQPVPGGGQPVSDNRDMKSKTDFVKWHLRSKTDWLKNQFGDYTVSTFAEPERDTTPAAELPKYVATDVVEIIDSADMDTVTEIFNLQGMRVSHPSPGNVYIVRRGNQATKALLQ